MGTLTIAAVVKCGVIILAGCVVFILAKVFTSVYGMRKLLNGEEQFYYDLNERDRSEEDSFYLHAEFAQYIEDKKAGLPVKLTEEMKDSFVPLNLKSAILIALRDAFDIIESIITLTMIFAGIVIAWIIM